MPLLSQQIKSAYFLLQLFALSVLLSLLWSNSVPYVFTLVGEMDHSEICSLMDTDAEEEESDDKVQVVTDALSFAALIPFLGATSVFPFFMFDYPKVITPPPERSIFLSMHTFTF